MGHGSRDVAEHRHRLSRDPVVAASYLSHNLTASDDSSQFVILEGKTGARTQILFPDTVKDDDRTQNLFTDAMDTGGSTDDSEETASCTESTLPKLDEETLVVCKIYSV